MRVYVKGVDGFNSYLFMNQWYKVLHTHTHTHKHAQTHIHTHTHTHIKHTRTHTHTGKLNWKSGRYHMGTQKTDTQGRETRSVYSPMHTDTCTYTHTHTHTHTYTHTHIHTHTYTNTYI